MRRQPSPTLKAAGFGHRRIAATAGEDGPRFPWWRSYRDGTTVFHRHLANLLFRRGIGRRPVSAGTQDRFVAHAWVQRGSGCW